MNTYKDAGGIWHEDRFRPLVTAIANLSMNLLMVNYIGIYGIILSTVLSMIVVGMPWLIRNLFSTLFPQKYMACYLRKLFFYIFVSVLSAAVTVCICNFVKYNPWLTIIIRGVICLIVPNIVFLIVYKNTKEFKSTVLLVDKMTHEKLKKIIKVGE